MNWTELKWHSGTLATNSAWPRMRSFMALWEHSTVAAKAGSEKGQLPSIAEILSYTLNSMWLSDVECTLICLPIDPPRLFPASTDLMLQFTAEVLNLPVERLNAKITDPRMHAERVRHSRRICCYAAMLQISLPDHPLTWWYSQVFPDPLEYFVWVSSSFFCSGTCHRVGLTKNRHCRSVSDFFLLWQDENVLSVWLPNSVNFCAGTCLKNWWIPWPDLLDKGSWWCQREAMDPSGSEWFEAQTPATLLGQESSKCFKGSR